MSTLSQAVAQVIRSEVAARQLDRGDFARRAGQSKTTAWRKINGMVKLSIDDVADFAHALGWSTEELLRRADAALASGEVHDPIIAELEAGLSPRSRRALDQARADNGAQEPVDPPEAASEGERDTA